MNKMITYSLILILAVVLTAAKPNEQDLNSTVTMHKSFLAAIIKVYDGDTILVRYDGLKCLVRLWGIDAPEHKQTGGREATKHLISLIKNKTVKIVPVKSGKYGRLIAKVYVKDKFINLEMIKAGYAWWYKDYAPKAKKIEKAQQNAKLNKRGLWVEPNPIEPQIWRKKQKNK